MVGPNFHSPSGPHTDKYTSALLPQKTVSAKGHGGASQAFILGENIQKDWWELYQSPQLNHLIREGLAHSPNLAAAKATLREAEENLNAQIGLLLFPDVTGTFSAERERFGGQQFGTNTSNLFNLYNASVAASYTLDIWGGSRRTIEAYSAQVDFQRYELIAAYLTLTSNIVTTAVSIATLESQIDATRSLIHAIEKQLKIIKGQFKLGAIAKETVLSQETFLEQTKATLPPLQKNLSQQRHAMSTLIGKVPSKSHIPSLHLKDLHLTQNLPMSLPSLLVRQRPDIQASEALLHFASANIGVATANLLPQLTLNGNVGWEGTVLSQLIKPANYIWSYTGTLTQTLFNGGAYFAQRRAAIDAFDVAFAQYRQTVLTAFQNVADALRAIQFDARTLKAQKEAEIAAKNNLDLTTQQYDLGGVNFLALLIAEQQYHQALILRVQAEGTRFADTAALYQALGGGWINCTICGGS